MHLGQFDPSANETTYKLSPEAVEQVSKLSSLLSHKVNNQLAFLINYLFLIKRSLPKDPGGTDHAEMIERLEHGVRSVEQLLKGTSDAARDLRSGEALHDEESLVKTRKILSREIDYYEHEESKAKIIWTGKDSQACLNLDSAVIIALSELLKNSLEAGATEVQLSAALEGEDKQISVTDNGKGIEPFNLPKIFTPFFTTKKSRQGLGLFMLGNLISRIGGSVKFKPISPSGIRVTLRLK